MLVWVHYYNVMYLAPAGVVILNSHHNLQKEATSFHKAKLLKLTDLVHVTYYLIAVCLTANMGQGVVTLIGPYDSASSDYVRSFASTFKIPHIQVMCGLLFYC